MSTASVQAEIRKALEWPSVVKSLPTYGGSEAMGSQAGGAEQYVLALDMGSSSVKSALVSRRGELAGRGFETLETILLPGGGAEQDPNQWWNSIVRAARRLWAAGRAVAGEQKGAGAVFPRAFALG